MKKTAIGFVSAIAMMTAAAPAYADDYTAASFSGGIFGGNANVKSPFSGNGFTQGQTFGGSFVFDNNLIPAGGTGFVNVFPSSFPDIANIPNADLFSFNFGPLVMTPSGADLYGIQYNNGQFNGFAYVSAFAFQGGTYQMSIQGGSLAVYELVNGNPTGSSLVNGYINIGNRAVTGQMAYLPKITTPAVPEPATWALMIVGIGMVGGAMRFRRRRISLTYV